MLKNHRGMEVILSCLQRFTSHQFLHPLPPRSVSLSHLLKLFRIQLREEDASLRLILLIESLEFRVHRAAFLGVITYPALFGHVPM